MISKVNFGNFVDRPSIPKTLFPPPHSNGLTVGPAHHGYFSISHSLAIFLPRPGSLGNVHLEESGRSVRAGCDAGAPLRDADTRSTHSSTASGAGSSKKRSGAKRPGIR